MPTLPPRATVSPRTLDGFMPSWVSEDGNLVVGSHPDPGGHLLVRITQSRKLVVGLVVVALLILLYAMDFPYSALISGECGSMSRAEIVQNWFDGVDMRVVCKMHSTGLLR